MPWLRADDRPASTHGFQKFLLQRVLPHLWFATPLAQAVRSFTFMATDPSLDGVGGAFYADLKPAVSSPDSRDEAKAKRFFALASELVQAPAWP